MNIASVHRGVELMDIYIVEIGSLHEPGSISGVFDTLEGAQKQVQKHLDHDRENCGDLGWKQDEQRWRNEYDQYIVITKRTLNKLV